MIPPLFILLAICAGSIRGGIANANSVVEEEDQFIAEETSELVTKQQKEYQVHVIDNGQRTTYTRWGRNDCPLLSGTSLMYFGYAAGSWYNYNAWRWGRANLPT